MATDKNRNTESVLILCVFKVDAVDDFGMSVNIDCVIEDLGRLVVLADFLKTVDECIESMDVLAVQLKSLFIEVNGLLVI